MRIIMTQTEIEEAISEKILRQMQINENMELKIDLMATRGDDGYTANIEVVEKKAEEPLQIAPKVRAARGAGKPAPAPAPAAQAKGSAEKAEEAPAAEQVEEAAQEAAPVAEAAADAAGAEEQADAVAEGDAPAPTGSIFAKLQKPVNAPAE